MTAMKKLIALMLAVIMVLSMAACTKTETASETGGETSADEPVYGGNFTLMKAASPTSFFTIYKSSNGNGYINACMESLASKDLYDQTIIYPRLAESWEFDEENHCITINLRQGVKFHDGSEMTAEVVKWNYDFLEENGLGGTAHNPEVSVIDEYTLKFQFDDYYLDSVAASMTGIYIYSKQTYDEQGLDYCLNHPVGTGAFKFVEYKTDSKITFEKFDDYWEEGLPYLDTYEVVINTDINAGMTAFVNGDVDNFNIGDITVINALTEAGYVDQQVSLPSNNTLYGFFVNSKVEDSPWADVNVRKAVMLYGLNYDEIALLAGTSIATVNHDLSLPNSLAYDETLSDNYVYDLAKAKQMLADAGYADGFETVIYAISLTQNLAAVLQEKLKDLGITAEVQILATNDPIRTDETTPGIYLLNGTGAWDITTKPLGSMFTPVSVAGSKSNGSVKKIAFSDEYLAYYDEAANATSYEDRAEALKKALYQLYIEDCVYVTCYTKSSAQYINERAHSTGMEYNLATPRTTWVDAE